jgi:ankyrin repeat protein
MAGQPDRPPPGEGVVTASEIHQAIEAGDEARVRALAPDHAAARDANGVSAVMKAIYHRRTALLDPLLASAPPPDVFEAASLGRVERLGELIGADPSCVHAWSGDGGTALHFAAFFRQPACARLLLERGADVSVHARGFGNVAPLHSAAASRSHEIVALLLDHGAPIDDVQQGGWTALMSAAHSGDHDLVELLLARGADPHRTADDGSDAAAKADEKGFADLAARLRGAAWSRADGS